MICVITYTGLMAEHLGREYLTQFPEDKTGNSCKRTSRVVFASIYSIVGGYQFDGLCTVGFDLATSPVSFQRAFQEDFVSRLKLEAYGKPVPVLRFDDPEIIAKIKAFADEREPRIPHRGPW